MPNRAVGTQNKSDGWSTWLLERRHGNDPAYHGRLLNVVEQYRDRVLDGAGLGRDMTLVDVGTGDGLLAFGAMARVGASLRVIMTDISAALLEYTEQLAEQRGVRSQCSFVQGSADKLDGIADGVADAVVTRAVLAYVQDKAQAFREFYRVLKPGGRISLAEPIYQDDAVEVCALTKLIEEQPNHPNIAFLKLAHRYKSSQFPATQADADRSPLTNYNERDLFRFAREAGFGQVHLELHIDIRPTVPIAWESYLDVANYPATPTLREVLKNSFSLEEADMFERTFRPIVEAGQSEQKQLVAYLTGHKSQS